MHFGGNWFKARDCSDPVPVCAQLGFNLIKGIFKKNPFEETKNGAITKI